MRLCHVLVSGRTLTRVSGDYIQLLLYTVFIIFGLPINLTTLVYMLRRYKHAKSLLLLLHINLNVSNILVLVFFCTGYISWMITYEWLGGSFLCVLMRFMDEFVFSTNVTSKNFSSNVMVCIAVYRLYALRCPVLVNTVGRQRIPRMLLIAWILSALISLPQLFVWKQVTLKSVTQCLSVWTEKLITGTSTDDDELMMKLYNAFHLLAIFYIPLVILIVCYVLILHDIYETLNANVDTPSAIYLAEGSHLTSMKTGVKRSKRTKSSLGTVTRLDKLLSSVKTAPPVHVRALRGQERLRRAKVKSLRITLLLILTYVITWLPYNFLSWWLMISTESYRSLEDVIYFLNCLVVLNSVINPFIYGRCTGLKRWYIDGRFGHRAMCGVDVSSCSKRTVTGRKRPTADSQGNVGLPETVEFNWKLLSLRQVD
ncbi:unnamed protein product [Anisakis simplex]|uniref:G_PROTEIN_RECEP_F1_2 domain-containing protein n=1 Tax=Anisakis simplex TaxID=6269 RepID=A0A0M3K1G4_ANISI|nr:unnamed protein product [Anisakis simplex]